MAKKKTDDAGIRFDPDNYVKIEYDKTAPSVKATIIQNGEVVEPDDYVTQGELSIILGDYVDTNDLCAALDPYATKAEVAADLANYPTKTEVAANLANYPTKTEVAVDLANYPTKTEVAADLANYPTKAELPTIDTGAAVSVGSVAANSYKDTTITFNKTFNSPPVVIVTFVASSTAPSFGKAGISVTNTTTTNATIRVFNGDDSARAPSFNWLAIEI